MKTLTGCAESGCTSHFIYEDTPCTNKRPAQELIIVGTPNGSPMTASHSTDLNLNHLHSNIPPQAITATATVLPSLKQPLLSLDQFYNAGSNILLIKDHIYLQPHSQANIQHATTIGTHNLRNGLWVIPLANKTTTLTTVPLTTNADSTAYHWALPYVSTSQKH